MAHPVMPQTRKGKKMQIRPDVMSNSVVWMMILFSHSFTWADWYNNIDNGELNVRQGLVGDHGYEQVGMAGIQGF
jgi:hypothetical protein